MAQHFQRNVCWLMHRRRLPRPFTRIPSTRRKRVRSLHPRTIHPFARRSDPEPGLIVLGRREQEHCERYHEHRSPAFFPPQRTTTGYPRVAAHASVRSSLFRYAVSHVLQRLHHHLYLHRRVSRILYLRLAVIQRVAGWQRSNARRCNGVLRLGGAQMVAATACTIG
jgi:hypothetical protein